MPREGVYIVSEGHSGSSLDASGRKVQGFCQWLSPNYAADSNPKRWTNEAVDLGSLDAPDAHATLLFYIYGEESEHVTSRARACSGKGERCVLDRLLQALLLTTATLRRERSRLSTQWHLSDRLAS